ncbi:MAG TPA: hypothetical protein VJT49_07850 [Amycolatopsis sp.]|uniref:hypothetical protein n=1 Tax=Amycolatopsis sp. TaxID=37632 RepID=UPI002B46696C|nr:hypothetical protein [Amycolatopsis sp.]HKS45020.1 hypothetical protein [Amycolatopsis sp.]
MLPPKTRTAGPVPVSNTLRALQLNLCHGGFAPCGGDSTIPEIEELLRRLSGGRTPPDLITLNEVCRDDIAGRLVSSMADVWPADNTFFQFAPAIDGNSGDAMAPYPCADGDEYGNAIIGHIPQSQYHGLTAVYGMYTVQSSSEDEKRGFGCLHVIRHYYVCTSHLEAGNEPVAMNQCLTLMSMAIPYFKGQEGVDLPTVVGADLNLRHDTSSRYDVQNCVPAGYHREGDGEVMHVVATTGTGFQRTDKIDLKHTDHDALMVTMTLP